MEGFHLSAADCAGSHACKLSEKLCYISEILANHNHKVYTNRHRRTFAQKGRIIDEYGIETIVQKVSIESLLWAAVDLLRNTVSDDSADHIKCHYNTTNTAADKMDVKFPTLVRGHSGWSCVLHHRAGVSWQQVLYIFFAIDIHWIYAVLSSSFKREYIFLTVFHAISVRTPRIVWRCPLRPWTRSWALVWKRTKTKSSNTMLWR